MKIAFSLAVAALVLAGCQTVPLKDPIWVRADGKPIKGNSANEQKAKLDTLACDGEAAKITGVGTTFFYPGLAGAVHAIEQQNKRDKAVVAVKVGCMADRGYLADKESDASSKLGAKPVK